MCEALLPTYRDYDLASCMGDVAMRCAEYSIESELLCSTFCAATIAVCEASPDKCTNASTACPKIVCKMGLSDWCPVSPGEAWDWCDLGAGLDGLEFRILPSVDAGSLACDGSSKTFALGKDANFGDILQWKCSGTDFFWPAASGSVRSNVTLQASVEKKCNPWPDCKDSCRMHWSWDATPG